MLKSDAHLKKTAQRASEIIKILELEYPNATIQLNFNSPFQALVATILSAQCTDERVNIITAELFKKYSTPEDFANLEYEELEKLIYSSGFYKAKSKHIIDLARILISKFDSRPPEDIDALTSLPGVGRKTANVVLGHCFGQQAIVVDTHVGRLARRLGFADSNNPTIVERELMTIVEKDKWVLLNHLFISHGRAVCQSRAPKCQICKIENLCPKVLKSRYVEI